MRSVITRVSRARVTVGEGDGGASVVVGEINEPGLLVLVGVTHTDGPEQVELTARKIAQLRILRDEKSAEELGAPVLIVSQFTLYGEVRKGRRPSWSNAAPGEVAEPIVNALVEAVRGYGIRVETGKFGAMMAVESVNDGPVTIWFEA